MKTLIYSPKLRLLLMALMLLGCSESAESTSRRLSPQEVLQWREDIDYLHQQLEQRHINLYHSVPAQQFARELSRIKTRLPQLTQAQLIVELMRVVKLVGDGHTQLNYWGGSHTHYPLKLKIFGEDIRLVGTDTANKHLLGMRLTVIDDIAIEEVIARLSPVLQGVENSYSEKQRLTEAVSVAEVLVGAGIVEQAQQVNFSFTDDQGQQHRVGLHSVSPQMYFGKGTAEQLTTRTPAGYSRHGSSIDGISLYTNASENTAYIEFSSYPAFRDMRKFAEALPKVFTKASIKNLIIDLRNNGGGDFFVGLALAHGLIVIDVLDWEQGIYVLTSGKTFSAAMSNAAQYRQMLNATLVGEPTGANPVGYQDADTFSLPNSDWMVMYSKRFYRFQHAATEGVQPDVYLPLEWEAFKSGQDNQLAWILDDIAARRRMN